MKSVAANTLSEALQAKAKRENRYYAGRVYTTKAARDAACAASSSPAKKSSPKKKAAPSPKKKEVRSALPAHRELVEVVINNDLASCINGTYNCTVALNGANAHADIAAYAGRNYKVTEVLVEVDAPLYVDGRLALGFANTITAGLKSPAQVSSLPGGKLHPKIEGVYAKKLKVVLPGPMNEVVAGTTVTEGSAILALELTSISDEDSPDVQINWYVKMTVDKVGVVAGPSSVSL